MYYMYICILYVYLSVYVVLTQRVCISHCVWVIMKRFCIFHTYYANSKFYDKQKTISTFPSFDYFQFSCQCDKVLTGLLRKQVANMRPKLR